MRFAKKDIYLADGGRRFIAAYKDQPIPAHYDHLVDDKDATDTPPSPASTAAAATDSNAPPEARDDASVDLVEKLKQGEDHELVLLATTINDVLEERGLNRAEPVVVPDGVVPGETPGWPVDAETGDPLDLPDEVREELAGRKLVDYSELKKGDLEELIEGRLKVLDNIEGSGSGGNIVTEDLVKALEAADAVEHG